MENNINLEIVGKVYKYSTDFKRALFYARKFVKEAFEKSANPYLSLSGGKDSVAMLGVVNEVAVELNRDFVIWSHVSDASFPSTVETIQECARITSRKIILDESPVSAFDIIGQQSSKQFGKTGYFFESIKKQSEKHDLAFVGVRAAESKRRKKACNAHGHLYFSKIPAPIWKCEPICWWTINDVAAALQYYNLPVHPIYKKFPTDTSAIRLGYATAMDLIEKGTLVFMKKNYPALYQKLIQCKPGLRSLT